jgi:hypothetical protein
MKLRILISAACAVLALMKAPSAHADSSTIKLPGAHTDYIFEAEPHAIVAPFDHFRPGVGFRGTIELVDNGFVKTINNTVGIGFGADWTKDHFRVPVVMQWNFWLTRDWSVFGEPGALLDFGKKTLPHPAIYAGGRYHFTDRITLTMRVGHPTASVGVSFLL